MLCCYFYRQALPFGCSVPKEEGFFFTTPSPSILTLCLLLLQTLLLSNKWLLFTTAAPFGDAFHFLFTPGSSPW